VFEKVKGSLRVLRGAFRIVIGGAGRAKNGKDMVKGKKGEGCLCRLREGR